MRFNEFIVSAKILALAPPFGLREVVQRLLIHLSNDGFIATSERESMADAVMHRESLQPTGIGGGVAVPHARHAALARRLGILGLCRPSFEAASIDGEPIDLVFLMLAPWESPGRALRVPRESEQLVRTLANGDVLARLRSATSDEQLHRDLLTGAQSK